MRILPTISNLQMTTGESIPMDHPIMATGTVDGTAGNRINLGNRRVRGSMRIEYYRRNLLDIGCLSVMQPHYCHYPNF